MLARRLAAAVAAAMMTTGLAAAAALPAQAAAAHGTELHAALHGSRAFPRAGGSASYESGDRGRHLDVHVWHIARLAGRHLVVYVHGTRAGTMTVTSTGTAHLDRHGAPACRAGQTVRVRTRSGTLVVAGRFRLHHHDG